MARNFRLTLCYDGTRYDGWQKQGNTQATIQGRLEELLSRLLGQDTELAGSGRTDAGVHAAMQVCSFRADTSASCEQLLGDIRRYLPEDIGAISLIDAPERFHARLSCREKTYIYRIWNSPDPNVFRRRYMLSVPETLDIRAMRDAARLLVGSHDFSAFCSNRHMKKSAVRELRSVEISQSGCELSIALRADGFLYNMARIIVGTLLEVGRGRLPAQSLTYILEGRDRAAAGPTAPALGLTLEEVGY